MKKKRSYSISGVVKTQVGKTRFRVDVRSAESIGATAERFERENPDSTIDSISVNSFD